jgi:hypothetical protein
MKMDIHSASPDRVEPLPFHRMTRYPFATPERHERASRTGHHVLTHLYEQNVRTIEAAKRRSSEGRLDPCHINT